MGASARGAWVSIFILALFLAVTAWFGTAYPDAVKDNYWLFSVCIGIGTSALASFVVILFGYQKLLAALQESEQRRALGEVLEFWKSVDAQRKGIQIIHGGSLGSFLDDVRQNTSIATIYSIQQIQETVALVFGGASNMPYREFLDETNISHLNSHVILLGGYLSIAGLKDFPSIAGLNFHQDFNDLNNRKIVIGSSTVSSPIYSSKIDIVSGCVTEDYALLTIITEAGSKRSLIWISGNYGLATYGAVLFLTRPHLIDKLSMPQPGHYVQKIIRITNIENNRLHPDHRGIEVCSTQSGDLQPDFSISLIHGRPGHSSATTP